MTQRERDLHQISTVIWAKVTGHPFWPARLCREDEQERHVRFRQRKNDVLVYFFAAGNTGSYGWVLPSNVKPFDPTKGDENSKVKNKSLRAAVSAATDFCERIARGDGFDSLSRRKFAVCLRIILYRPFQSNASIPISFVSPRPNVLHFTEFIISDGPWCLCCLQSRCLSGHNSYM